MNIWSLIGTPWTVIKSGQKDIFNSLTLTEESDVALGRRWMMILLYKVE